MNDRKLVSAEAMSLAVESDPQFQIPQRPRFGAGFVTVPVPNGLLIEGAAERQVFRGKAALSMLPRLLALLDGTRTLEEVHRDLPDLMPEAIRNAVALLYTRGMLEDGAADEGLDLSGLSSELVEFLRRHVDMTRVNRSAGEAIHRIRSCQLGIVGEEHHARRLQAELTRSGMTSVTVWGTKLPPEPEAMADLVVALVAGAEEQEFFSAVDEWCGSRTIPWLRTVYHGTRLEVGPYFDRNYSPCYRCFETNRDRAHQPDQSTSTPAREQIWTGMLATEVFYLVSRICPPVTVQEALVFDLDDWSQTRMRPVKLAGCPICCPIPGWQTTKVELGHAYEQMVAFPPKHLLNPKDHQHHYKVANLELQREGKNYPGAPRVTLPPPAETSIVQGDYLSQLLGSFGRPSHALTLSNLAGLLLRGVGLRAPATPPVGGKVARWAPTGGNLGSVQAYLIAHQVDGLAPGCYHYVAHEHVLAHLAPGLTAPEVIGLAERALGCAQVPDLSALLVLTGAYYRVSNKYGPFAYRILHLDAGAAIAQLRAVATGYGLDIRSISRWNDHLLLEELDLDEDAEPITGVLAIYKRGEQHANRS